VTLVTSCAAFAQNVPFDFERGGAYEFQRVGLEKRPGGIVIEDVTFPNLSGGRTAAYLVTPPGRGAHPAALFVHWYESEAKNSNRTQFLEEAVELAHHGLLSLLVETPWSDPQWYAKRDVSKDFDNSVLEVKELRRVISILLSIHGREIDTKRLALVGHDFGAMYGILAASADQRVSVIALQAFTSSFSDWFLYNQRALSPEARQAVIDKLAPLDPIKYLPNLGSAPVLLQFSNKDFYVPREKADAIASAVTGPKQVLFYDAGHGLNEQASKDRVAWLRKMLALK
jgi:cephalosporin-C deacetylase-like acetyl esterase